MSSTGSLLIGIMILIIGFAIVTNISDNDDRALAAVAFIGGIIGTIFICTFGG